MKLERPNAILFDWDNTLTDTWPIIYKSLNKALEQMGHAPWSMEKTKQNIQHSLRDSFPLIFGKEWEQAGEIYLDYFRKIHLEQLVAHQQAELVLATLQQQRVYVAVVSNKTGKHLREEVKHLGWGKYFKQVIGAKDATEDKPSPKPVELAMQQSGFSTFNDVVWFIGDSQIDMICAHETGCTAILFGEKEINDPCFKNAKPHYHVKDHNSLLKLIQISL